MTSSVLQAVIASLVIPELEQQAAYVCGASARCLVPADSRTVELNALHSIHCATSKLFLVAVSNVPCRPRAVVLLGYMGWSSIPWAVVMCFFLVLQAAWQAADYKAYPAANYGQLVPIHIENTDCKCSRDLQRESIE